jgi:hypothetical protein
MMCPLETTGVPLGLVPDAKFAAAETVRIPAIEW